MCYKPVSIRVPETKRSIFVSCRQCLECRQRRANEWALRCMLEAEQYTQNCFITLTYSKSPLILDKTHLQNFMKRFRKAISPHKIRYFSCGEYGSLRYRPHFHILVFGYDFPDKYVSSKSDKGYNIYNSPMLEKLWGHGMTTVQDLTLNSCAYCALYSSKPRKQLPRHLRNFPEFNTMSFGLGIQPILDNLDTYLKTDEIWLDGRKHIIPDTALKKAFRYTDFPNLYKLDYHMIKNARLKKYYQQARNLMGYQQKHGYFDEYEQKQIRAENKEKRLKRNL